MHPVLWVPVLFMTRLVTAPSAEPPATESCMSCHADRDLKRSGPGTQASSVFVDHQALKGSAHQDQDCWSCHPGLTADNHASGEKRGSTSEIRKACLGCHEPDQGLHGRLISAPGSPGCSSCHGSHSIKRGTRERHGCMSCHKHFFEGPRPGAERVSLQVDHTSLGASAHQRLSCQMCHPSFTDKAHPKTSGSSRVERVRAMNRACRSCHRSIEEHAAGGVHARLGTGQTGAPGCTDCHGAHEVSRGSKD